MKKITIILFLLMLGIALSGFSQASAPSNFFVGKWKAALPVGPEVGPRGEVREATLWIDIARKEGKLTVHLGGENIINSRVQDERPTELTIVFDTAINPGLSTQQITARDVHIDLAKVDDNTLETSIMGMPVSFKRVK